MLQTWLFYRYHTTPHCVLQNAFLSRKAYFEPYKHLNEIHVHFYVKYSSNNLTSSCNIKNDLQCGLKQGLSQKPAPRNQQKLQENLEDYMSLLQNNQQRVKKYFDHQDIKYAA